MTAISEMGWYYSLASGPVGPVTKAEMRERIMSRQLLRGHLVWREGMTEWLPAERTELEGLFPSRPIVPPPLPASTPVPGATPWQSGIAPASGVMEHRFAQGQHSSVLGAVAAGGPAAPMGFGEAINYCLKNYVKFSGRGSRSQFWFFALFLILGNIVTIFLDAVLWQGALNSDASPIFVLNTLFSLGTFLPSLASYSRRFHDAGWSFWWVLLVIIPLVGWIFGLVVLCSRGEPEPNRFEKA